MNVASREEGGELRVAGGLSLICTTLIFTPACILDGASEIEGCRGNDLSCEAGI